MRPEMNLFTVGRQIRSWGGGCGGSNSAKITVNISVVKVKIN